MLVESMIRAVDPGSPVTLRMSLPGQLDATPRFAATPPQRTCSIAQAPTRTPWTSNDAWTASPSRSFGLPPRPGPMNPTSAGVGVKNRISSSLLISGKPRSWSSSSSETPGSPSEPPPQPPVHPLRTRAPHRRAPAVRGPTNGHITADQKPGQPYPLFSRRILRLPLQEQVARVRPARSHSGRRSGRGAGRSAATRGSAATTRRRPRPRGSRPGSPTPHCWTSGSWPGRVARSPNGSRR